MAETLPIARSPILQAPPVVTVAAWLLIDFDQPDWSLLPRFDWTGLFAMAGFLGALEYALEEGPSMMTNFVDCDFAALKIGQDVKLKFVPSEDGPPVPMFAPV